MEELLAAELPDPVAAPPRVRREPSATKRPGNRQLAAWSAVTRTLLNLDEFITRE